MSTDARSEAERFLAIAARHLTEHPGDMRIAEVAAQIGNGYAVLAITDTLSASTNASARRNQSLTPAFLRTVAAVYQQAEQDGTPPTRAVADHFGKSHSTAAKWVGHARRTNHLPPAQDALNDAARAAVRNAPEERAS